MPMDTYDIDDNNNKREASIAFKSLENELRSHQEKTWSVPKSLSSKISIGQWIWQGAMMEKPGCKHQFLNDGDIM